MRHSYVQFRFSHGAPCQNLVDGSAAHSLETTALKKALVARYVAEA